MLQAALDGAVFGLLKKLIKSPDESLKIKTKPPQRASGYKYPIITEQETEQ